MLHRSKLPATFPLECAMDHAAEPIEPTQPERDAITSATECGLYSPANEHDA